MSFYRFEQEDIIETSIVTNPSYTVELNGGQSLTGSIFLDKPFLEAGLETRTWKGFSAREGGTVELQGPFSSSVGVAEVEQGATNKQLYNSILALYDYYSFIDPDYTPDVTGSTTTYFKVITIPEIYYDRGILTGSFTASDRNSDGDTRTLYDNGRGGIYSGSLSGTLVGNIFYSEGLVVLKGGGLTESYLMDIGGDIWIEINNKFGENGTWKTQFKGVHTIPVNIFRCRAPATQVNASTNPTFYYRPDVTGSLYFGEKVRILSGSETYITRIGLYNDRYELCGVANLAQPIRKDEANDILFRIRLDR